MLLANVRGAYLGDAAFDPLFDFLDARRAVVFIHPSNVPGQGLPTVPPFMANAGNLTTLDEATQSRINRTNAEALFPRFCHG